MTQIHYRNNTFTLPISYSSTMCVPFGDASRQMLPCFWGINQVDTKSRVQPARDRPRSPDLKLLTAQLDSSPQPRSAVRYYFFTHNKNDKPHHHCTASHPSQCCLRTVLLLLAHGCHHLPHPTMMKINAIIIIRMVIRTIIMSMHEL